MKWWYSLQNLISSNEAHKMGSESVGQFWFKNRLCREIWHIHWQTTFTCIWGKWWSMWYPQVMNLMKDLTGKLHKVYMDNFYSAPALFLDLLENSMYARGTKSQPRKPFPNWKKLKKTCLKPTDYQFPRLMSYSLALQDIWVTCTITQFVL